MKTFVKHPFRHWEDRTHGSDWHGCRMPQRQMRAVSASRAYRADVRIHTWKVTKIWAPMFKTRPNHNEARTCTEQGAVYQLPLSSSRIESKRKWRLKTVQWTASKSQMGFGYRVYKEQTRFQLIHRDPFIRNIVQSGLTNKRHALAKTDTIACWGVAVNSSSLTHGLPHWSIGVLETQPTVQCFTTK